MRVIILWWDLSASEQSIDSLQAQLGTRDENCSALSGLPCRTWTYDRGANRWGLVLLGAPSDCAEHCRRAALPADRLIGYPPTDRWTFDLNGDEQLFGRPEVAPVLGATPVGAGRAA